MLFWGVRSCICLLYTSWAGFSFMAFLVLMTWIMLMTSILLLVGLWNLLHHYENRRKERNLSLIHIY